MKSHIYTPTDMQRWVWVLAGTYFLSEECVSKRRFTRTSVPKIKSMNQGITTVRLLLNKKSPLNPTGWMSNLFCRRVIIMACLLALSQPGLNSLQCSAPEPNPVGQKTQADLDFRKSLGPSSDLMLLPEVCADHVRIQPGVVDLDTNSHPTAGGSPLMLCFQVIPGSPEQLQLGGLLLLGLVTPILLPGVKPVGSAHPDRGHFHLHPSKHIRTNMWSFWASLSQTKSN